MPSAKRKVVTMRPATTPEAREKQLEALAMDLAEKQLREGTASSSVVTHFLKLASTRDEIEKDLLASRAKLTKAKADDIASSKRNEEIAEQALDAMKSYGGTSSADNHE